MQEDYKLSRYSAYLPEELYDWSLWNYDTMSGTYKYEDEYENFYAVRFDSNGMVTGFFKGIDSDGVTDMYLFSNYNQTRIG